MEAGKKHFERPTTQRMSLRRLRLAWLVIALCAYWFLTDAVFRSVFDSSEQRAGIDANQNPETQTDFSPLRKSELFSVQTMYRNSVGFLSSNSDLISTQTGFTVVEGIAVTSDGWFAFPISLDAPSDAGYRVHYAGVEYGVAEVRQDPGRGFLLARTTEVASESPIRPAAGNSLNDRVFYIGVPPERLLVNGENNNIYRAAAITQRGEVGVSTNNDAVDEISGAGSITRPMIFFNGRGELLGVIASRGGLPNSFEYIEARDFLREIQALIMR